MKPLLHSEHYALCRRGRSTMCSWRRRLTPSSSHVRPKGQPAHDHVSTLAQRLATGHRRRDHFPGICAAHHRHRPPHTKQMHTLGPQPSNPDTAIAVIFVLFFLCIIAAAAGLIWGIAGLAVRMQTVVSSPDQPASRPGTRSTGRLRWLNGWRLLTGSLVTGAILFLFIGDWMIRDDYCLQWLDHTPIPLPPFGVTQTIMYATVALGLAGLIWGVVDLFIKIERRRQGRP